MSLTRQVDQAGTSAVALRESPAPPCRDPQPSNGQDQRCLLTATPSYEPHGFEGLLPVEEDSDAVDLAFDEVVDIRGRGIGGGGGYRWLAR